jgi:AMIN domain
MRTLSKVTLVFLLSLYASTSQPQDTATTPNAQVATIQRITLRGGDDNIEVEIAASKPVTPQAQLLSGPDRIVVDLPGAVPGKQLRDIPMGGALRAVRVGLFSAKPPVTRVVLDLKLPQKYHVSTVGNKVMVNVSLADWIPSHDNNPNQQPPQ